MAPDKGDAPAIVLTAAHLEVARLERAGIVTPADEARLDARFEVAATAALRVPAFAERSAALRRLATRVVPPAARPPLRRGARLADRVLRRLYVGLESARSRR